MTETIERRFTGEHRDLMKQGVPDLEPNVGSDVIIRDADTGEPVIFVGRYPADLLGGYRAALRAYPFDTVTRMAGTHNNARSFGYLPKSVVFKRNGCRACLGAEKFPAAHGAVCAASSVIFDVLAEALPERKQDLERASEINADWRIGGPWTSGVVNYDSPLPYHFDANNLPCWSAMPVVRRGVRGGHLHVPAYEAVIECRDGDIVFFPGYDLLHGVTPLRRKGDGYRISAVYYAIAQMRNCRSVEEELEQGRNSRSERETDLIERQRQEGLLT